MSTGAMAGGRSSLLSDSATNVIGALGAVGFSGLASIVIARELGVTGRGRWAVIASLATLVGTFADLGLSTTVGYAAGRLQSASRAALVQAAMIAAVALGAVAAAVFLVIALVVDPPAPTAAVVVAAAIPVSTVLYRVTHAVTLTAVSVQWFAAAQLATAVATLAAVITVSATGRLSVLDVVVISAGSQMIGLAVNVAGIMRYRLLGERVVGRPSAVVARELRPYLGYALLTFATLSLTQVVQRVDVLLVNGYRGAHAAGLYAVASQFSDLLLVLPAAVGFVLFRRGAQSAPDHWSDALRALRWMLIFGVLAAAICWLLAGWLVSLLFGSAYSGSTTALRWLLPGAAAFSVQSVLSSYVAARGRPRVVLLAWLVGSVAGVGADLLVIPRYGIVGAAVVSSVSYAIVAGLHVQALRNLRRGGGAG